MKSTFKLKKGFEAVLNDGRGHDVVIDLPIEKNGTDLGTSALELCAMSLTGCVGTIFTLIAAKMRIEYTHLEIELDAEKTGDAKTITDVSYTLKIKTETSLEKVEKCLTLTESTCPVGILFKNAGISISNKVVLL